MLERLYHQPAGDDSVVLMFGDGDGFPAKFHQTGTRRMPARALLGFPDADIDLLRRIVENRVAKIAARQQ